MIFNRNYYLPCKRCGSALPIVRGSTFQCPYCNTLNFYMESIYSHKNYLSEILNITSLKSRKKLNPVEIDRRKALIEKVFREISSDFSEYRHLILTKLDDIDINSAKIFKLIRLVGNLENLIENELLIYLKDQNIIKRFQDIRDNSYIINKSLLGLYFSYLAKKSTKLSTCNKSYYYTEKNFQNIVDYYNITEFENSASNLERKRELYSVLAKFAYILRNILSENPKLFSDELRDLLKRLDKIEHINIQKLTLYSQIEQIYQLERNTSHILENVKIHEPLISLNPLKQKSIFNTEEKFDILNKFENWIQDASRKYQKYQRELLKLHSGQLIDYLESYRSEFIDNKNKNMEKFDKLLNDMIRAAIKEYNLESIELLDTLGDFIKIDVYNGNIIQKFELERDNLMELDELLKNFINSLFKKPILKNLEAEYYAKLISIISGKHTEFDNYILEYINHLLRNYEDFRSKKILSIEEQRNQFSLELKPNLQKLVDMSFSLNDKYVPYPLFMNIDDLRKDLKVNNPDTLTLMIENPNLTEIKDIKIYFFLPNSFQSDKSFINIKRLKPNESRKIKRRIIPKKKGTFPFMVMIEYQHTNNTFWMPSIKLNLEVTENIKSETLKSLTKSFYTDFLEIKDAKQLIRFVIG